MQHIIRKGGVKSALVIILTVALIITSVFTGSWQSNDAEVHAYTTYPWEKTAGASSGNYIADSYGLPATDNVIENVPTDRLLDILSAAGTHYVLFSNPQTSAGKTPLPQKIVPLINAKAKALGISKVYHFDTVLDDYQLDITGTVSEFSANGATQSAIEPASWAGSVLSKPVINGDSGNYAYVDESAADLGGVNSNGHLATWVGRIWTLIKAKFPTSSVEIQGYTSGDVLLVRFSKASHQTAPADAQVQASAYFAKGTEYTDDASNAAIDAAFKSGGAVVVGNIRSQYDFYKRTYNITASYFNTFNVAQNPGNKVGKAVEVFSDTDFPAGKDFKFVSVTVPELYNILNSTGYKPVLIASTGCHNTQASIGEIAKKAKSSSVQAVYVLEPSLSGTVLFGEGENADKVRFSGATGGVHIRDNRNLAGDSGLVKNSEYSYLYGELVRSFIPNLQTENLSKHTNRIAYYQNGAVDNLTVASSATWTNAEPWGSGRTAAPRLQIPYLFGYEKASGQTKTWLHKKTQKLQEGGESVQYSEYMLDLAYVFETAGAKALAADDPGSNSVDLDSLTPIAFAQEAVGELANVLPQSEFVASPVPTISGTAKIKSKLTVKPGTWKPKPTFRYQWKADGKNIKGATKSTLTLAAAQVGKKITVSVTATAKGYPETVKESKATAVVKGYKFKKAPVPKIIGSAKVGKKLKVNVGKWSPKPKYTYKWYANNKAIKGATKATLKLKKAQKGKKITVKVTAKKSGYNKTTKTSKKTAKVKK